MAIRKGMTLEDMKKCLQQESLDSASSRKPESEETSRIKIDETGPPLSVLLPPIVHPTSVPRGPVNSYPQRGKNLQIISKASNGPAGLIVTGASNTQPMSDSHPTQSALLPKAPFLHPITVKNSVTLPVKPIIVRPSLTTLQVNTESRPVLKSTPPPTYLMKPNIVIDRPQLEKTGLTLTKPSVKPQPITEFIPPPVEPEPKDIKLSGPEYGKRLQALLKEIDPNYMLEPSVEELLLQMADDFVDNIVNSSMKLARHRKSATLGLTDVQLCLRKQYGMHWLGMGPPPKPSSKILPRRFKPEPPSKTSTVTDMLQKVSEVEAQAKNVEVSMEKVKRKRKSEPSNEIKDNKKSKVAALNSSAA